MVERYQPTVANVTAVAYCGSHPDGQYVRISDYDALAARLAESDRELSDVRLRLTGEVLLRKDAEARLAEAESECLEQARLNGMGSEREARLHARLAKAVAALHGIAHADTEASALRLRFMAADALIAHNTASSADEVQT